MRRCAPWFGGEKRGNWRKFDGTQKAVNRMPIASGLRQTTMAERLG
jgi:hypothetical protein